MHRDVDAADRMLCDPAYCSAYDASSRACVDVPCAMNSPSSKNISIQRIRFQDRLAVMIDVVPEALDCEVPSLILQPLVENAIRHGIEPLAHAGHLTIGARRDVGELVLTVRDNGPGLPAGGAGREGIGLANTRARLAEVGWNAPPFHACQRPGRWTGGSDPSALMKLRTLIVDEPTPRARAAP